ncbi:serine/threonine-protein phosphatase [Streptomyces sp. NBC_01498]|uniref:PP2C family protein-serine/threonine phosphatase n=1 Tax=Streptomyces sp. NBC_01498 TaxID=2975870 RepID=UPI002E7B9496|nr:PP2C family protein-serine/threonine phosphatase [Streptomyces sp. NBC_01498]WTL28090.1 serine/threonine-protein phosphatase [Streptomyces sp. NBC_01498]
MKRSALRTAPYPVLVADTHGVVRFLNDTASALLPDAWRGTNLSDTAPAWLAAAHHALHPAPAAVGVIPGARSGPAGTPASPAAAGSVAHGEIDGRTYEAHPTREETGEVMWWLVDDTDRLLAHRALRVERARTAFLGEASNALLSSLNLDRCTETTAALAAGHLADAAVVVAPPTGRGMPAVSCTRGGAPVRLHLHAVPDQVPGLPEALQGFPPVPSRWIDPATAPAWLVPEGFGPVGSIVVTPLPGHGVPAGALVMLRRAGAPAFSEGEEVFARLFAARAGAALSAARLYAEQSSITETLMRELLPPVLHEVSGVEFAGAYRASAESERVGGDFYDVHPAPAAAEDRESLVVLGDVCGKGLEAAVLTGKIRNTLHALLPMADDHQRVISLLNGALLNSHHTRFATLVLASAVRRAGKVRLRLTSAGHPAPLIVRGDGQVEEAGTRGTLVGALPEAQAVTVETSLAPGETCVLFTDGITEARGGPLGGDLYGEERLHSALSQCAGMPAEAVVEHVQMLAAQWVRGGGHDDMAVVAITAPRNNHLSAVGGRGPGRFTA